MLSRGKDTAETCLLSAPAVGPRRVVRHLLLLGFPRLDPDAPDVHFLLGLWGLRQQAAKPGPQVVPGLRFPLPGELDLHQVPQVLLCVDQEGVGGIQPDLLHSTKKREKLVSLPGPWETAMPCGVTQW